MLAEQAVYLAIKDLAPTYPDVAPEGSALPRIVFQQAGGPAVNYTEDTPADEDIARIQVACWAETRMQASALSKQVERTLIQAAGMQARPIGARVSVHEPENNLYGARQDFSVWCKDE